MGHLLAHFKNIELLSLPWQTVEDSTVTLRERDSTAQVRIAKADVAAVVRQLSDASLTWSQVQDTHPAVLKADAVDE